MSPEEGRIEESFDMSRVFGDGGFLDGMVFQLLLLAMALVLGGICSNDEWHKV